MSVIDKQRAEQAVVQPPEYIRQIINETADEPKVQPGSDRDRLMLDFAQSDVWKILKKYMESRLSDLATSLRKASDGNSTMEEVGYRFMVADRVNSFATSIIGFVETPLKIKQAEASAGLSDTTDK